MKIKQRLIKVIYKFMDVIDWVCMTPEQEKKKVRREIKRVLSPRVIYREKTYKKGGVEYYY